MRRNITMRNFSALALSLFLFGAAWPGEAVTTIQAQEVRKWQEQGRQMLIVDVRTPEYYGMGHIEASMNVPAFALGTKHFTSKVPLIVYCNDLSGYSSMKAAQAIEAAGHTQVFVLEGGLDAWEAAEYPRAVRVGLVHGPLVHDVTADDLRRVIEGNGTRIARSAVLIDLRSQQEFTSFNIPSSINVPVLKKPKLARSNGLAISNPPAEPIALPASVRQAGNDQAVVLVDGGNGDAMEQAELLRRQGIRARFLSGGIGAYKLLEPGAPKSVLKKRSFQ